LLLILSTHDPLQVKHFTPPLPLLLLLPLLPAFRLFPVLGSAAVEIAWTY